MFSKMGEYQACGIFTIEHFILIALTVMGIAISLKKAENKTKKEVHQIIMQVTIIMCILEIIKIIFNIHQNSLKAVNTYLPLYYCSMLLYAGIFSSFAKGTLKRVGDVFLATGSIVGGIVFIIYPSTSLPMYPFFHFLSIHSFLFHGSMVYLGILVNKTRYIELKQDDIKYFAGLILSISAIALIVNNFTGGNLMFISNNFPGTPIEIIYKITNGGILFTVTMVALQMIIPFYVPYYIIKRIHEEKDKNDDITVPKVLVKIEK